MTHVMKNSDILPWGTLLYSSLPQRKWSSFLKGCFSCWLMMHGYNKENVLWILTKPFNSSLTVPTTLPTSKDTTGRACILFPGLMSLHLQQQPMADLGSSQAALQGSWPHLATKYWVNLNISGNLASDVDNSPFRGIPELGYPQCSSKSSEDLLISD